MTGHHFLFPLEMLKVPFSPNVHQHLLPFIFFIIIIIIMHIIVHVKVNLTAVFMNLFRKKLPNYFDISTLWM